ncbi:MAG: hypothetical protein ACKO85_04295, partial [Isosphaeraceae bacterium]
IDFVPGQQSAVLGKVRCNQENRCDHGWQPEFKLRETKYRTMVLHIPRFPETPICEVACGQ